MLLIALAIATSMPLPPPPAWTLDVPVALHAHAPVGNVDTAIEPWIGVRLGREYGGLGLDGAVWLGGTPPQGTAQVSSARWLVAGEGRALWSFPVVSSTFSALSAYPFLALGAGGGAAHISAFDDVRLRPLFTWQARVGGGGELVIHRIVTRLELAAGVRDFQLEVSSALAIGIRF